MLMQHFPLESQNMLGLDLSGYMDSTLRIGDLVRVKCADPCKCCKVLFGGKSNGVIGDLSAYVSKPSTIDGVLLSIRFEI